jgi:hypothetical protein
LNAKLFVPRPIDEVFAFFSNAHNLQRITPANMSFTVLTPAPIEMREGTKIDYKLRVRGFPIRWQSLISVWDPPNRFVDRQTHGPYKLWHHEHRFVAVDGGTMVEDEVTFKPIGGRLMTALFVGRDIKRIFELRSQALAREFGMM